MDSSKVGVLKERYEVRFRGFLESHHCRGLEAEIRLRRRISTRCQILEEEVTNLEVLRDFTDKTLEGELADEALRRLLVPTDLTKSDGTRPEAMGLLHTTSRRLRQRVSTAQSPRKDQLTAAVLRAADLAASCLRGALPNK